MTTTTTTATASSSPVESAAKTTKFSRGGPRQRRGKRATASAPSEDFLKNLKALKQYIDEHGELPSDEEESLDLYRFVQKHMALKRAFDKFHSSMPRVNELTQGGMFVVAENETEKESEAETTENSASADEDGKAAKALRAQQQARKFHRLKATILTWSNFQNKYRELFVARLVHERDAKQFYHKLEVLREFAARKNAPPIYDRKKQVDPDESKYGQARSRVLKYVRDDSWPEPAEETRGAWEKLKAEFPFLDYTLKRRSGAGAGVSAKQKKALNAAQKKEQFLSTVDPELMEFIAFPDDEEDAQKRN